MYKMNPSSWINLVILLGFYPIKHANTEEAVEQPRLLFVDGDNIIKSSLTGQRMQYIISNVANVGDLDFDYITETLYWTNKVNRKIYKAYIGGSQDPASVKIETFVTLSDIAYPNGIAVDWHNRKLYWNDASLNTIERINLDGTNREVFVDAGLVHPTALVIDPRPEQNNLYWIDQGFFMLSGTGQPYWDGLKIEKKSLNGTDRVTLVTTDMIKPTALALDMEANFLYWVDKQKHTIERCDTVGWSRTTIVGASTMYDQVAETPAVSNPGGLTITDSFIFWTEITYKEVLYVSKSSRPVLQTIDASYVQPGAIHAYNMYRQPVDGCDMAGGCEADIHECTDKPTGPYLCSCAFGTKFNNGTCEDVEECLTNTHMCQQKCINTEGSYRCECMPGYNLENNTLCVDIDECQPNNQSCDHNCINTPGSFYCSCNPGYDLEADLKSCDQKQCTDAIPEFSGVTVMCDGVAPYYVGHKCQLVCDGDLVLYGEQEVSCSTLGMWTKPAITPVCRNTVVEPPTQIDWSLVSIQINPGIVMENALVGYRVGEADLKIPSVFSGLSYDKVTYNLNTETEHVPFTLIHARYENHTRTYVITTGPLDYETQKMYKVNMTATVQTDNNGQQTPHTIHTVVTIHVTDVNEPPSPPTLTKTTVSENAKYGKVIARFQSEDLDASIFTPNQTQRLQYSLLNATDSHGDLVNIFSADEHTALVLYGHLDYEKNLFYTVTIQVQDTGIPMLSAISRININVIDVNEAPTDILLSSTSINEIRDIGHSMFSNMMVMPTVGILTVVDEDRDDEHTFEIVESTDALIDDRDCFQIIVEKSETGKTTTYLKGSDPACLNYEEMSLLEVTIQVTDAAGNAFQKLFRITVLDVNEPPTKILLLGVSVQEHVEVGKVISIIVVQDPDKDDEHNITLLYSTNNWLKLQKGNQVVVAGDIDFETSETVEIILEAEDKGGLLIKQNFSLRVDNVEDAPGISVEIPAKYQCPDDMTYICVNETLPMGVTVARIITRPLTPNNTFIRDPTGTFVINDKQEIQRSGDADLDYESGIRTISIRITSASMTGLESMKYLYVKVLDVNEAPKAVIIHHTVIAPESPVGTNVSRLECEDDSDMFTYELLQSAADYAMFTIVEDMLQIAAELTETEYKIAITCSDGVGTSPVKRITLEHNIHAGDNIIISLDNQTVTENSQNGTVIGMIQITSDQPVDMFTISLEDAAWLPFVVTPVTSTAAVLSVSHNLDYEQDPYLDIVVKAVSSITKAVAFKTFEITVINEPERLVLDRQEFEECPPETNVAFVLLKDPTPGNTYMFTITTKLPLKLTNLTATSVTLTTTATLDYEDPTFGMFKKNRLKITVFDSKNAWLSKSRTYQARIINVNEAPSKINITKTSVFENTEPGTVISKLVIEDPDTAGEVAQTFTCDFILNDHGWFTLNNNLEIVVANGAKINYEDPYFTANGLREGLPHIENLAFDCWDQGGLGMMSDVLELLIINVNEKPTDIWKTSKNLLLKENSPVGTWITTFTVKDPDVGDNYTMQILPRGADISLPFTLNGKYGNNMVTTESLNYEERIEYKIKVLVTDSAGNKLSRKFRVDLTNENDPPTEIFIEKYYKIPDDAKVDTFLTFLHSKDQDQDQGHTYEIISQNPEGALKIIESNKLVVSNPSKVNYEEYKYVNLTVKSTDQGTPPLSYTQTLMIEIENMNEAPTEILLDSNTVVEGAAKGTVVGNISFVDPDGDISVSYYYFLSVINDMATGGEMFEVVHNWDIFAHQLVVKNGDRKINFETQPKFNLTILVMEMGLTHMENIIINVIDVDDPVAGLLFEVAIPGGNPPLEPNVTDLISSWTPTQMNSQVLTVPEQEGLSSPIKLTVAYLYVLDEDMMHSSYQDILDNYKFTVTEQVTRVKRQSPQGSKFDSPDASSFSVEGIQGSRWLTVTVSKTLDFEARPDYLLSINVVTSTQSFSQKLHIVVADMPELPYSVTLDPATLDENNKLDVKIGSLSILNQDSTSPSITYQAHIVNPGQQPFYISGLDLFSAKVFNFEENSSYEMNVSITEIGPEIIKTAFYNVVLNINDVAEAPCCLTVNGETVITVPVSKGPGFKIGDIKVTDEDRTDINYNFVFKLFSGDKTGTRTGSNKYFSIMRGHELTLTSEITQITTSSSEHILYIQTNDSTGLSYTGQVKVNLVMMQCGPVECHEDAVCDTSTSVPFCQCKAGYTGNGTTCRVIDSCLPNPCYNHGKCYRGTEGEYLCQCKDRYQGLTCEIDSAVCWGVTCDHGGTCVPKMTGYSCYCDEPYTTDCSGCMYNDSTACKPLKPQRSTQSTADRYLGTIIGCCLGLLLLVAIVIVIIFLKRSNRFKTVNRRVRFHSESSSITVQGETDFKRDADPNQFDNPLYETVPYRNNNVSDGAVAGIVEPDYTKKVPLDLCDPNVIQVPNGFNSTTTTNSGNTTPSSITANAGHNTNPSAMRRAMSRQEEMEYNLIGESET